MEEEEYQGVSFGRIVKVAFHRWKLLLILTLSIGLVGFFGVYFGYNYFFNVYEATFEYTDTGLAGEVMADNTTFNYKSLVSKETLQAVKDANPDFYASLDIEKLAKQNAFTIKREVDEDTNRISYTVSVKRNKVPNIDLVRAFYEDLANYPIGLDKEYVTSATFDTYLKQIPNVEKFEDELNLITSEANLLISGYSSMASLSTTSYTLRDEINGRIFNINTLIDSSMLNILRNMIINHGLFPDYSKVDIPSLNELKDTLLKEQTNNQKLIDALEQEIKDLGDSAKVTGLSAKMESLIERNLNIDLEIEKYDKQIANYGKDPSEVEGHAQFVKEANKMIDGLAEELVTYKAMMKTTHVDKAKVSFDNNTIVNVTKNMNVVFSILIPVAAGLVVAIITNLIVDRKMLTEEDEPVAVQ